MAAGLEPLVVAAAKGDTAAYSELVTTTSPLVSSITLAIVRDLELSRDVAQDVFLAVWRDLKKLRSPASFLPWLRQTARNRAKTALRQDVRKRSLGISGLLDEVLPQAVDPRPNISERMLADEERQVLADALEALPEETREVLTLFYREGQSISQVASLLDLSEDAVKKRLSRARAFLRKSIQQEIGEMLCRTAPGAAFTAAVVIALPATAPSATAAALGTTAKTAGGATVLLKLLAPLSGVLLGGVGGVLGVIFGTRKWLKDAQDAEERRGLYWYMGITSAMVMFYAIALTVALTRSANPLWAVPWFLMFVATLALLQHVWLPSIVRRRMEAEMRRNPIEAAARRRREKRQAILGWTIGLVTGSVGLALGLWSALR
ncbi:MAG TPA: sigma-70 family RNA polymerase sigma factor [Bryobacteraceae bacterium]|nr:sigma-70 family RNA polymerase sigma factor [Bryobacteraceae bacterium]